MEKDKENKESKLLNTAFSLFTSKGVKDTSIQEIVDSADVGKGTFYLYFKDKYEIRDILIVKKSQKLFNDALKSLRKQNISDLTEQIIFVVNHVIDALRKDTLLLSNWLPECCIQGCRHSDAGYHPDACIRTPR